MSLLTSLLRKLLQRSTPGGVSTAEGVARHQRTLTAAPADIAALNDLAVACNRREDFPAAEAALRIALAVSPDSPLILGNLAVTLLRLQRLAEAEECARKAIGHDEGSAEAHFVLAQCLQQRGSFDEADHHFAACSRLDPAFAVCSNVRFSDSFFAAIAARSTFPAEVPASPLAEADSGSFDHVVLVSCDVNYFERYGGSFVHAFAQHAAPRALLHVHLIGDDGALVGRLQQLAGRLDLKALQCSIATLPEGLDDAARPAYYASARYIYMNHWLERYRKPIVCVDIDALARSTLAPLAAMVRGADLGLMLRDGLYSPWTQVVGGTMVVNPTPKSAEYFETVARYLGYFFLEAKALWWLDQIALYCVLRHFEARGRGPRVVRINEAAEDAVWQFTRTLGEKEDDALYARYRLPV